MNRAAAAALLIGLALASCGGDKNDAARPAPTDTPEGPSQPAPAPSGLPPEFLECMAKQGYDVEQGADIHSAPMELLQTCFGSLHGGAP